MKKSAACILVMGLFLGSRLAWGVTFGEQGEGSSYDPSLNIVRMSQYVCPANGQVNYLMLYVITATGS